MNTSFPLLPVPRYQTLQEMLAASAQKFGAAPALQDIQNTPIPKLTYSELHGTVLKFGAALANMGIKPRSHVALIGENRVQWGVSYLALASYNYVVVPIDKNLTEGEILNIVHDSDAVAVIHSGQFHEMFLEKKRTLKNVKFYVDMDLPAEKKGVASMTEMIGSVKGPLPVPPPLDPQAMYAILYTSGTLGRAKGVMLSQANITSNLSAMLSFVDINSTDRFLSVLPIHHTYECTCGLLCPLHAGATVYYARSLKTVVDDLQSCKATILLGVPLLYDKMFKRITQGIKEKGTVGKIIPSLIKATNFMELLGAKGVKKGLFKEIHEKFGGHIKLFIAGGAAPDPMVAKGLRDLGFMFIQGYGLTETSPILALNRMEAFKDNAAGLPLPGVEVKIDEPDNEGVGEIIARGPNVMLGYYKNPEATAAVIQNGWFRTGDLGRIDKDGFVHILGRKKNMILSKSGKNVYPEEIEDFINRSPFVQESMVYGEKDAKQDEVVAVQIVVDNEAFITYSETQGVEITPELIKRVIADEVQKVNNQIPSYKHVRKIHIREQEFQKTTTQKIKRFSNVT